METEREKKKEASLFLNFSSSLARNFLNLELILGRNLKIMPKSLFLSRRRIHGKCMVVNPLRSSKRYSSASSQNRGSEAQTGGNIHPFFVEKVRRDNKERECKDSIMSITFRQHLYVFNESIIFASRPIRMCRVANKPQRKQNLDFLLERRIFSFHWSCD